MKNYIELITEMKNKGEGLMSEGQYLAVGKTLDSLAPCNFLVFGLGHDAYIWEKINHKGRTTFLEDDKEWSDDFKDSGLEVYNVEYTTRVQDYGRIGFDEEKLKMDLPSEIRDSEWDVIFVDGPLGHNPPRPYKGPGRMQSMYAAYNLLKVGGICICDDMGRLVEKKYSSHYFGSENLYNLTEGKVGFYRKAD